MMIIFWLLIATGTIIVALKARKEPGKATLDLSVVLSC